MQNQGGEFSLASAALSKEELLDRVGTRDHDARQEGYITFHKGFAGKFNEAQLETHRANI